MIKRLLPAMTATQSPLSAFGVLLVGQGFGSQAEFQTLIKLAFWSPLIVTSLFERLGHLTAQNRMFLFYDPCEELDLQIAQDGSQLSIPSANRGALATFLQDITVQSDARQPVTASQVLPTTVRSGGSGSLIVAILKGTTPGEHYQLDASDLSDAAGWRRRDGHRLDDDDHSRHWLIVCRIG
jgi:hypothetical protein